MRKYGASKTTRIMMATVPHVTSGLGLRKFQADGFLLTRVYINTDVQCHGVIQRRCVFYAPLPCPQLLLSIVRVSFPRYSALEEPCSLSNPTGKCVGGLQPSRAMRILFTLVHTFTNRCMYNDTLPGTLLATEPIGVTRNGESQNLVPERGTG